MCIFYIAANGIVKTDKVEEALRGVDRGQFCKNYPYKDSPQSIGFGVTISAPHMVRQIFNLSLLNVTLILFQANILLSFRLYMIVLAILHYLFIISMLMRLRYYRSI